MGKPLEEIELSLLHQAVDKAEAKVGKKIAQSPDVLAIISILETFMRRTKVVCYGGTAINNILPAGDQFYNKDIEVPDYDFYSPNAISDAKRLADIYANNGYEEVEARSGVHDGTYKLFVNFLPIADITQMEPKIFRYLYKKSVRKDGISYAPPDFLRLAIYKELASPEGDVSRWEKVYKRFLLLNKHYPLKDNPKCLELNFMRDFNGNPELSESLYNIVKNTMIDEGLVFIGGFASSLYSRYMPADKKKQLLHVPDFDVLAEDPKSAAYSVKERLQEAGFEKVKVVVKPSVGNNIILTHYEIIVDEDTICFIYKPAACYSYNTIKMNNKTVKIGTIDTLMFFLLAFMFADRPYYDRDRILCMAQYLINVQSENRIEQKGLLKRFNINCYGIDKTLQEIRADRAEKYKILKYEKGSKEYEKYFLKYVPYKLNSSYNKTQTHSLYKPKRLKKTRKRHSKKKHVKGINNLFDNIF